MGVIRKIRSGVEVLKEEGIHKVLSILRSTYGLPIPQSTRSVWKGGINSEIGFWDDYFRTKGLRWADTYWIRFDPDLPLQSRVAALLPPRSDVCILDVGAGPLTYLGKKCEERHIHITAVDPLADEYDEILDKYHIQPLVRTQKLAAEELTKRFPPNAFDLVVARNCIDHAYHPERAILQMIHVVKKGCYVLLEHRPNEGEKENYAGLHQWNFSLAPNGNLLVSSKSLAVNMSKKYSALCSIECEMVNEKNDGDWLITRIQKNA